LEPLETKEAGLQELSPSTSHGEPDRTASDRAVHHEVKAHPNDLIDPWWMNEVIIRGYRDFLYNEWPLDFDELPPDVVEDHLPDDLELKRRAGFLTSQRVEFVVESGDALAAVQLARRRLWTGVGGPNLASASKLLGAIEESFPRVEPMCDEGSPSIHLGIWGHSNEARGFRRLEVEPWGAIRQGYAPSTCERLETLMAPDFRPGGGTLLVWHGPPGTGKSFALGALAYAWREWAAFSYIADPAALLDDSAALLEYMTLRDPDDRWRVAILEDTGELFGLDASSRVGQTLSRLLNASDGMLGHGSKTMFVITTNERVTSFHPAVIRPGRCAALVGFEPLSVIQAKEWLVAHDATAVAGQIQEPATVAQLFAMLNGSLEPSVAPRVGVYL
jgi:ATPase family associated with various cellular activities (AAA)